MVSSAALTAEAYLDELGEATRAELVVVRSAIRTCLPAGIVEGMDYGMITWAVPLSVYADTSNGRPLAYAALAAQKRYNSLYLLAACSCVGGRADADEIARRWSGAKPLKMGKSCIRFREAADLDLELIAEVLRQWTVEEFVAFAESERKP